MKTIILTLALAAVAAIGAHAQIGVGVGYASTTLKGDNTTTNLGGLTFGATYNIPLVNGLAVAPGIQFAMQNYKEDANNYRKENYIAIPVMFNYGIELVDGIKVVPYLGPTLSYGISGVVKGGGSLFGLTLTTGEVNLYGDNSTYAPFDILVGGGVALDVMDMVRAYVGYNIGLLDRNSNDNAVLKASGVNFGVAYLF